jgi:hypothetical protein
LVNLCVPIVSTVKKIAVRSSCTPGVFLDKSPRFLELKGITMPGLMFMVKDEWEQHNSTQ